LKNQAFLPISRRARAPKGRALKGIVCGENGSDGRGENVRGGGRRRAPRAVVKSAE